MGRCAFGYIRNSAKLSRDTFSCHQVLLVPFAFRQSVRWINQELFSSFFARPQKLIMLSLIPASLLLAATASAQVTTSFWAPVERLGDDKRTYYASVAGVTSGSTTLVLDHGNKTKTMSNIPGHPWERDTVVVGSTIWQDDDHIPGLRATPTATAGRDFSCTRQAGSASAAGAVCTASWAPDVASRICASYSHSHSMMNHTRTLGTYTITHTRSHMSNSTNPGGMATIVKTIVVGTHSDHSGDKSMWCTNPAAGIVRTRTFAAKDIHTYTVVITAGTSMLTASQAAGATGAGATATGSGIPKASNPAAPLMTAAPGLLGLGVAAAAFFI